jgi:hypothetical protein
MKKENLTERIVVRVSPSQKRRIFGFASKSGLEVSDYLRWLALRGIAVEMAMPKQPSRATYSSGKAGLSDYEGPSVDRKQDERLEDDQERSA